MSEWLFFIRMGLMLVAVSCAIIAIYKTYKTLRMSNKTIDESFSRLDNQLGAVVYAIIACAISTVLVLIRGV